MENRTETRAIITKIYNKYINGDTMTNAEIDYGLTYFKDVADSLSCMGPVFRLAFVEANRVAMGLEGFKTARERK